VSETVLNQQEPKLEPGADTQRQNNNLKKIVGIILSLVMVGLTIYVLNLQHLNSDTLYKSTSLALDASDHATNNYRTYVGKYKVTKVELDETTHKLEVVKDQLNQVSIELATTKNMLSQTQSMLSQAQEENTSLKKELQGLDELRLSENVQNIGELQNKIQTMKEKDSMISDQIADLKKKLREFDAEFADLDEGKTLINLFQKKIRLVKSRMHDLKEQAYLARVAAQKEKDRLAVLNGNSGFFIRNGQVQNPNGTNKSFAIDVKIVQ